MDLLHWKFGERFFGEVKFFLLWRETKITHSTVNPEMNK